MSIKNIVFLALALLFIGSAVLASGGNYDRRIDISKDKQIVSSNTTTTSKNGDMVLVSIATALGIGAVALIKKKLKK